MNWYKWGSHQAFEDWHTIVCQGLGIPHPNCNASTGETDLEAQWTMRYTDAYEVDRTDWRAIVQFDVAAAYPDGLGAPSEPPPAPIPTDTP